MIIDNINNAHQLPAGVDLADVIVRYKTPGPPAMWHIIKTRLVAYANTQHGHIIYYDGDFGLPVDVEDAVVEFGFFRRIPESDENGDEPVSPDSLDGLQTLVDSAVMDSVSGSIGELVGSAGKTS